MGSIITVTVTVNQAAAIMAGLDTWDDQQVRVDLSTLTDGQREVIANLHTNITYNNSPLNSGEYPKLAVADISGVIAIIDAIIVKNATETAKKTLSEQEQAEKSAAWMALPDNKKIGFNYRWEKHVIVWPNDMKTPPAEEMSRLNKICDEKNAAEQVEKQARIKIEEEQQATKEIEKAREEEKKINFLTKFVHKAGTALQIERWDAGVMERSEALDIARDVILRPYCRKGLS